MFRHAILVFNTSRWGCACLAMWYWLQSSLWSHVSPCSRVLSIPHVSPCTVTGSCCMFRHAVDDLGTRLLHVSPCCRTFRHAVEELGTWHFTMHCPLRACFAWFHMLCHVSFALNLCFELLIQQSVGTCWEYFAVLVFSCIRFLYVFYSLWLFSIFSVLRFFMFFCSDLDACNGSGSVGMSLNKIDLTAVILLVCVVT